MDIDTPTTHTTPTTTTGCRCTERCKCRDAPKRPSRFALNNENIRGINLFGGAEKPGKFPNIEITQTPPSSE